MGKHKAVEGILTLHLTTILRAYCLDVKFLRDFNCRRSTPGCADLKNKQIPNLATYNSSIPTRRLNATPTENPQ